jgi:hypothetical protein
MAGEYTAKVMLDGIGVFIRQNAPAMLSDRLRAPNVPAADADDDLKELAKQVPMRPAGFCTGCPAAVQYRWNYNGLRAGAGFQFGLQCAGEEALDRGDGRWRLLAQRAYQRHRQCRIQQA